MTKADELVAKYAKSVWAHPGPILEVAINEALEWAALQCEERGDPEGNDDARMIRKGKSQ